MSGAKDDRKTQPPGWGLNYKGKPKGKSIEAKARSLFSTYGVPIPEEGDLRGSDQEPLATGDGSGCKSDTNRDQ